MTIVWFLILLVPVVILVTSPFWRGRRATATEDPEMAALEAAREAKYREIRDAEADRDSGKLSPDDFKRVDAELRSEAVVILDRIEELKGREG